MSYRRIAGTIALVAMLLSLGEGLAAGVCVPQDADGTAAHAAHGATGHDAPPADRDADDSTPDCPMTGAAPMGCSGFALAPAAPARTPLTASVFARAIVPGERMPASHSGLPLFHPPRA